MAVSRAKKIEQVEKLGAELKNVSSLIIATYSKLTVAQGITNYARLCAAPGPSTGW